MKKYYVSFLILLLFILSPTALYAADNSNDVAAAPTPVELVSFSVPDFSDLPVYAVPLGSTAKELTDFYSNSPICITAYDHAGNAYSLGITDFDINQLDTSKVGTGYVTAKPDITGYTLAKHASLPSLQLLLSVQVPGQPRLDSFYYSQGYYYFPWLLSADDLSTVSVWLRSTTQNNIWAESEIDGENIGFDSSVLYIKETMFASGASYGLQVDYGSSHTNILNFVYYDSVFIVSLVEGDRDGNDSNDDSISDSLEQLPPESSPADPPVSDTPEDSTGSDNSSKPNDSTSDGSNNDPVLPDSQDDPQTETPDTPPAENTDSVSSSASGSYESMDGDTLTISGTRLSYLLKNHSTILSFG
ncbi:MAG: hypothetical protein EOM40_12215 [Clostridia bacterium]|nr:hypothetical protein [Clostridia bacterium]